MLDTRRKPVSNKITQSNVPFLSAASGIPCRCNSTTGGNQESGKSDRRNENSSPHRALSQYSQLRWNRRREAGRPRACGQGAFGAVITARRSTPRAQTQAQSRERPLRIPAEVHQDIANSVSRILTYRDLSPPFPFTSPSPPTNPKHNHKTTFPNKTHHSLPKEV